MGQGTAPIPGPEAGVDEESLIGTTLAERYRIERLIGVGAMGRVYRAEHVHMCKPVALKVLHARWMDIPDIVQRFELEAQAAARIEHPNVVSAMDFGKLDDGTLYLALEYVEGQPLAEVIAQGPVPALRVLDIAHQVTSALVAAHAQGIVHRDLKPDNLILAAEASGDCVKVLDFGIAKLGHDELNADKPLTLAGMVYGTPEYMAPEQALAQPVDGRADIYALGVIMFELLTGQRPYLGPSAGLLGQQLSKPLPKMADVARVRVPEALEQLVAEMLATDPRKRPASASAVLDRIIALERAPSALPREQRMGAGSFSRMRVGWTMLLLVGSLAAGVGGAIFLTGSMHRPLDAPPLAPVLVPPPPSFDDDEPESKEDGQLQKEVQSAKQAGIGALMELAKRHPNEGFIQSELALEFARAKRYGEALDAIRTALALDPKLNESPKIAGALFRAAQSNEVRSASFRLLEGPMGAAGVSIIYDLAHTDGIQTRVRLDAQQLLTKPAIRDAAAPSLLLLMDLEAARKCEEIAALVRRAAIVGDKRVLPLLQGFTRTTGCGPKDQGDCYACLRQDDSLMEAIHTIGHRSTLSDGADQ